MTYFGEEVLEKVWKYLQQNDIKAILEKNEKNKSILTAELIPYEESLKDKPIYINLWSVMSQLDGEDTDVDIIKQKAVVNNTTIPKEKRLEVIEFLNKANSMLVNGCFSLNDDEKVVHDNMYTIIKTENTDSFAEAIQYGIRNTFFPLQLISMPLQKLIDDNIELSEAVEIVKMLLNMAETK